MAAGFSNNVGADANETSSCLSPSSCTRIAGRTSATGPCTPPCTRACSMATGRPRSSRRCFRATSPGSPTHGRATPTGAALEAKLNLLEETRATICFATGMAAISATFFALLRAGDHVVSSRYVFGNTASVLRTLEGFRTGGQLRRRPPTASRVAAALQPNTRLVFAETIANPRTQVADLAAIGDLCRRAGAGLRRRQHDDHARAVQAANGRRQPRDQLPHQGHRRPCRRHGRRRGRHRTLRLARVPQHRSALPGRRPGRLGHGADTTEGTAGPRRRAASGGRPSHQPGRGNPPAADRPDQRQRHRPCAVASRPGRRWPTSTTPAWPPTPSTGAPPSCSAVAMAR